MYYFSVHRDKNAIHYTCTMSAIYTHDLTVATVCRNALATLPRCIASVSPLLKHPTLNVEHLLIDGASTDGSQEYLQQELINGNISRLISEPDKGLYDAMNKAIELAHGKVIVFINADDEICPAAVEACCEPILNGRAKYTVASALYVTQTEQRLLSPCMNRILWRQPYCHQSMYCATELLRQFGGFQWKKFHIGADTDFMRRLYAAHIPYEVIPTTASHFHAGGLSSTPAVISESYELIIHFQEACKKEVSARPTCVYPITQHIRRYATQKILSESDDSIKNKDYERLSAFLRDIIEGLPFYHRIALFLYVLSELISYVILAIVADPKNRPKYTIRTEISQLLLKTIAR